MRTTAYVTLAGLLLLVMAAPGWAQQPAAPQEPPDLVAYRPIYEPATPAEKKIELAEAFLAETRSEFLDSTYRDNVFLILFRTYREEKNWVKVLETVDRQEKLAPKTARDIRVVFYSEAMRISTGDRQDVKKVIEYAEKVIAIDPNNVNALLNLAIAMPPLPDDPGAQERVLMRVVGYGRKVLTLDKPAALPENDWQNIQKTIRIQTQSLLAMIPLIKKDYVECAKAYEALIALTPKDAGPQYRLGICYYYQVQAVNRLAYEKNEELRAFVTQCNVTLNCNTDERNKAQIDELEARKADLLKDMDQKREKALDAFGKSVAIGGNGPEPAAARAELEKLYKYKIDQSKKDEPLPPPLEDFIAQKKREMGS